MKTPTPNSEAEALARTLEKERAGKTLRLGTAVKDLPATKAILASPPEVQVAFVQHIVGTYTKLGASNAAYPNEWFRKANVPRAGAEVVRLLLRKRLPLTDSALAAMFKGLARVRYLSLVEFLDQLVGHVEKSAAANPPSPPLRQAMQRFADVLVGKQLSPAAARHWKEDFGFPRAVDRKIAGRVERLLAER